MAINEAAKKWTFYVIQYFTMDLQNFVNVSSENLNINGQFIQQMNKNFKWAR